MSDAIYQYLSSCMAKPRWLRCQCLQRSQLNGSKVLLVSGTNWKPRKFWQSLEAPDS